jgi:hypothetical protein
VEDERRGARGTLRARRGTVDPDVRECCRWKRRDERVRNRCCSALGRTRVGMGERCASDSERHCVSAWVAGLHSRRVFLGVGLEDVMIAVVIMCGGAVVVFGMVVIRVEVRVQSRHVAHRGQSQTEQDCHETPHHPSVCNAVATVKLARSREAPLDPTSR